MKPFHRETDENPMENNTRPERPIGYATDAEKVRKQEEYGKKVQPDPAPENLPEKTRPIQYENDVEEVAKPEESGEKTKPFTRNAEVNPTAENTPEKFRPIQYEAKMGKANELQEKRLLIEARKKAFFAKNMRPRGLNFELILNNKVIHVQDSENGEEIRKEYVISVLLHMKNGKVHTFPPYCVEANKVKNVTWLQEATDSLADLPTTSAQKASFMQAVQTCLETEFVSEERIYPNPGWRNVPGLGYRFVYGGGIVGQPGVNIHTDSDLYSMLVNEAALGRAETFHSFMGMRGICRSGRVSTLLLVFTHASLMETLFELAGFPINFVFGIVGITNARKTSLALEIAQVFHREEKRADAEFTATACGLEKKLGKYKDGVIIIDDFRPGETKGEQQQLRERLRTLVRFYGNRVPKQRMDDYGGKKNKKFFPIQGGCVLTMEWVSGVQSSLSRMFLCEINKDEVNNETLAAYQNVPWLVSTHFYDFLMWVTENFGDIVNLIRINVHNLRTQYRFTYGRFGEMYAVFCLTAEIIGQYARQRGFWDERTSADFGNIVATMTVDEIEMMEDNLKESDRGRLALNALSKAISEGQVQLTWLTEESCIRKENIYEDSERIFIRAKELRRLAIAHGKENELATSFTEGELIRSMEGLGVLEIYEGNAKRERSRKLPCQRGNTLRYLFIKKEQWKPV